MPLVIIPGPPYLVSSSLFARQFDGTPQHGACPKHRTMDKSLDELAAEGNKGKRRREDYGRRQGGGDRRDGRVRRGAEGATREAYCFFGDSFVRLFGLVCHPEVSVKAFKGATCRGLGKDGNENRVDITRRLAAKPETKVVVTLPSA